MSCLISFFFVAQEGDGVVPEEVQRRNPNAIKFTGGPAEVPLHHFLLF